MIVGLFKGGYMGIVNSKLVSPMLKYDIEKGRHQSYMATGVVTIMYVYKGILFTINCDAVQQFKVYDEINDTCYLFDASTLYALNKMNKGDGNLKLIVRDNTNRYGDISYASIVHVGIVKLPEPVKIYNIHEDFALFIENHNHNEDSDCHYIEYINLYMAEEFIEDITINGTIHKCKFKNVKPGKVIYKEFLYSPLYNFDNEVLEFKSCDDRYIVKKSWTPEDLKIKNLIHASDEKLDISDIRIKTALMEYIMTNKAYGCTINNDSIHFKSKDITFEKVVFSYISYVYKITSDEPIPDEGCTDDNLYFKRITDNEDNDDLFMVVPTMKRFKYDK